MRRTGLLAPLVLVLVASNLGALWLARGDYVPGWDLFGATYGVLALNETGSFLAAVRRVTGAFLAQAGRPVFTGGESYIHGLLPGLLDQALPWLLWGNLVCLALVVAIMGWLPRRLPCRFSILWACVLASPALISQSIVGLPHLSSTAIPFGLAIGYCLSESRTTRGLTRGVVTDVVVFAAITFYAFNGYESGKTFWIIPAIAAVTLPGVALPRRVVWSVLALGIARLTYATQAMTTVTALAAVPREPGAFLAGLARIPRRYLIDWWIDCPALLLAAIPSLLLLPRDRLFWTATLGASAGLVSLSAFQFDGGFLSPHRFLLLIFVCALIVAIALSEHGLSGATSVVVATLVAGGAAYTCFTTIRFVRTPRAVVARDYNQDRTYPLPYNHSGFENQLWLDRIHDAVTAVDLVRHSDERHLFLYGFSALGEDGVNPQLFVSRLLLPLGYRRFTERVAFFDHFNEMFFRFPIQPLAALPAALGGPAPFVLHVREPEYSGDSIVARYLNQATVAPVDLGLIGFRSYRVSAYAPPGPIPIQAPDATTRARIPRAESLIDGFCVTTWDQQEVGHSPLRHWDAPLGIHLDTVLREAAVANPPAHYGNLVRRHLDDLAMTAKGSSFAYAVAYVDNPGDVPEAARFTITADDELAVIVNGQTVEESRAAKPAASYDERVLLPPGRSELRIAYHKFWNPGGFRFAGTDARGVPLRWQSPADCAGPAPPS